MRPEALGVNGQSPKKLNGHSEKDKKQPFSSVFSPNKPMTMTIKIGKETMTTKQLTNIGPVNNSLVPYGPESSDEEVDSNDERNQV